MPSTRKRAALTRRLGLACAVLLALGIAWGPATGLATRIALRTSLVSVAAGRPANGPSGDATVSASGAMIAFDSSASDLTPQPTGGVRNVFVASRSGRQITIASQGIGGATPNGSSLSPTLSATGATVAFTSAASNLVPGDGNGVTDVFVRTPPGPVTLVSVGANGLPANGPSSQPSISGNGRYVAFTSSATNLVPGDHSPAPQVYVRDTVRGITAAVSVSDTNTMGNAPADSPAISEDGSAVSFDSAATNLDPAAHSGLSNVFVRLLSSTRIAAGATALVSVSSTGRPQNQAVQAPFHQISSVSQGGRYVAFDSNATNLVPHVNNGRSEVFLYDRASHRTTLVSENNDGVVGDNDSFAPTMTAGGHFVVFESLASNLAPGGGPRENLFVRDLHSFTTSVINVGAGGAAPSAERGPELLQRPAITDDARFAVFSSTASGLTATATNGVQNVYLRNLTAPRTTAARLSKSANRVTATLSADDPAAKTFLCRIDRGLYLACPAGRWTLPGLSPGRHVLSARAGGPGMLFERHATTLPFTAGP